jgi:SAM-dependent methyltransferase
MVEQDKQAVDMGKVYDEFAKAFREADQLPTWCFVGKVAMERLLKPALVPGAKILDMGSASARVEAGVLLPNGVLPNDITGVEISPDQVAMATHRIPGARFLVGNVADPELLKEGTGTFDVVFSHMVFEHLDDAQLARTCENAFRLLKGGGTFAFVVTHPDKMTDLQGNLVTTYGPFETTAPWGGQPLHNWRRSIQETVSMVRKAGFVIELTEEIQFPEHMPQGLSEADQELFRANSEKYRRYPAIRLAVRATKKM